MDTESFRCEIKKTLPELEDETLRTLAAHLIDVIGVRKREDLIFVGSDDITLFLTPIQSRKLIQAFKNEANGQVASTSSEGQEPHVSLPYLYCQMDFHPVPHKFLHSLLNDKLPQTKTSPGSAASKFHGTKMPARLLQAMEKGCLAHPEDRRVLIRVVVEAMQAHCKNPSKAICTEVARLIVCKYPGTFADKTGEGEQLGCGYYSLFRQLKTRVEHINRDNVSNRIRQPRKRSSDDSSGNDAAIKRSRTDVDSYGCTKWQPTNLPQGETAESLEDKRKILITIFKSEGPTAVEAMDVERNMELTYIYQRHMINTWPPPSLCEVEEQWPFLFTKRGLCSHFHMLTDIDIDTRLHEAFLTKGRRIINFFLNQRLKWSQDIQALLREMEHESMNNHQVPIAAILLLMKYFQEKEDHIFILTDPTSTKMSVEQEMTLPTTPRVIMLGSSLLFATHWMVSIEGKVFYEANQLHNFASAFAVFFGSFYVFNLEYQESASTTLEMVQR
uniref:Uncharacterized protein n=1 Tax=Cyprinus carpio carpio TaxID=630221 RepID=A0A9J7XDH2_CYPCA